MKFEPVKWSWKYADWVVVIIALAVGFTGFFLPGKDKDLAELERVVKERKANAAELRAKIAKATAEHEALTAREREEYGIVYIPTPAPKPAPPPPAPAKKPD